MNSRGRNCQWCLYCTHTNNITDYFQFTENQFFSSPVQLMNVGIIQILWNVHFYNLSGSVVEQVFPWMWHWPMTWHEQRLESSCFLAANQMLWSCGGGACRKRSTSCLIKLWSAFCTPHPRTMTMSGSRLHIFSNPNCSLKVTLCMEPPLSGLFSPQIKYRNIGFNEE